MSLYETLIVLCCIIAATVAAIVNHLTPELAAFLGIAIGYGAKGAVTSIPTSETAWKGAPDEQENR